MAVSKKLYAWSVVLQTTEVDGITYPLPPEDLIHKCVENLKCSKYAYQLEKGDKNGKLHYQMHLVLEESATGSELRKKIKSILRNHWSKGCCTTKAVHSQSDSEIYCLKSETREAGPWFFPKNRYTGQDLLSIKDFYPWQEITFNKAVWTDPDPRDINCIVDPIGNSGKSILSKGLGYNHDACVLPLGLSSAQMKAAICSTHPRRIYIVDLPRNNKSYQEIFDTIEEIKRGFVISSFHGRLKSMYMERPHVFVFSNAYPDLSLMSFDMWKIYTITSSTKELVQEDKYQLLRTQRAKKERKITNISDYTNII